ESIDALVERALSEQLIEGRRAAPGSPHVEERDAPAARAGPADRDLRGEIGITTAADRNEQASRARQRALHHGDVARRIAQDIFDRRAEEIPARTPPRQQKEVGPRGRPCSRARARIRITGVSSARSTASAICSPFASGGT